MINLEQDLRRLELSIERGINLDREDELQLEIALKQLHFSELVKLAQHQDPWERIPDSEPTDFEYEQFRPRKAIPGEPWQIQITPEFIKSTEDIDRKIQGRILEAIIAISNFPMTRKGDTIKSLTGDLAGIWRYRIGDFRLLYKPDADLLTVFLLTFCSRAHAYD